MNPNFLYPHPDANASSLAHLHHLPPGANPAPNPAPIPPQLHNRAQPQRAPLHPEQDGMDVDTGPDPRGTARESSPDQSPERGLKRARPDTDQAETLEHSEPVYKQRRTSSPEPTHAQPQARAILSPEAIKTELRQAVGDGNLDRLVSLKKQVGNIAEIFDQDFEWIATHCPNAAVMAWFVGQGCNIHQVNSDEYNALILAAAGGHLEVVQYFAHQGCDMQQVNIEGDNALTMAARYGHIEVVKWLFEKNCYVHQVIDGGDNALTLAAAKGHLELVKWLFEKNCYVHQVNSRGNNALTLAAAFGHIEVVKWLITQNCSVRQVNSDGDNALTIAARYGHIEVVKWLFEKNCSVHQVNDFDDNALTLAAAGGHLELVKWLFEKNCSVRQVDNFGNNALTIAAAGGHLDVVKWLFEKNCAVDQVNISGDNALTLAVRRGHLELVQWLVEKGSDIDHLNNDGRTALALAMAHKETAIACDLIKRGANVHIGGSTHGDGLLFDALDLGDTVLISLLIPLHDVSLRSASRRTPLMVAAKKNLIEVAAPLIQASSASPLALTLIAEAFPLAKKPLFRELLWNPPLTSNAIPLHSSLLPDMTPLIASAVVSEHIFSDNEKLLSLQSKLGAGGLMNLMQMRSAKMSVLAELPAWILQHPVEEIFNDASLSDDLVRLQNKVITFIKDDIEVLATIATGWEEAHLIPVVENLYESCLRHCLSEHPATDIVSTLSGAGLYQPIAQRIANAWMSAWATVPRAAPLLRPVAATHIDDRDNEDLADLDPNTGEVVIRPDTVARNIGRFIDSPTGAELLRAFSTALQREFDSVAASILRINDTQLSEQSKNLYADLIGRQLHLIAQFWRATA